MINFTGFVWTVGGDDDDNGAVKLASVGSPSLDHLKESILDKSIRAVDSEWPSLRGGHRGLGGLEQAVVPDNIENFPCGKRGRQAGGWGGKKNLVVGEYRVHRHSKSPWHVSWSYGSLGREAFSSWPWRTGPPLVAIKSSLSLSPPCFPPAII